MADFAYDTETLPNIFTLAIEACDAPFRWSFEISDWQDDSARICDWILWARERGHRMVGFNNLGFDYPILHMLCRAGRLPASILYQKAMAIIHTQDQDGANKWVHQVYPSDRLVEQIDLFKIHHFDNKARRTSLKALEFAMRSESIVDMPIPVGTVIRADQRPVLHKYNAHDVSETKKFYHRTLPMIRFREELTAKYGKDFMNHNDTKIGKDFFVMQLEKVGVSCYDYDPETGRSPRQTKRPIIRLGDAVLPWIKFNNTEFQRVLDWFRMQSVMNTKNAFEDKPTAHFGGIDFVFGTGGIHASVENKSFESDDTHVIVDLDVSSYYPNLAIHNRFFPEHLGEKFCDVYKTLYEMRSKHAKGTPENAMLKLALNGVYGDSNNPYSVFYDPLFTMSITLNGQFLLCLLAEMLCENPNVEIIQCNTDGITVRLPRTGMAWLRAQCAGWEMKTGMTLERVEYKAMYVRDVNSYIAVKLDGKTKRKGAYEYELEWNKDPSMLVVPKIAEKVLVEGAGIRETLMSWPEPMDFMSRIRVNRGSYLCSEVPGSGVMQPEQNTCRYYVAQQGVQLWKWMPPTKTKPNEWRKFAIESGRVVQLCNDLKDGFDTLPDYDYYITEIEKLCLRIA